MFEMLHSLGLSNIIFTPILGTKLVLVGFAYVNNSDLLAYSLENNSAETAKKMQSIIDSWEKAATKCWWYMVEFEWDENCNSK